MNNKEVLIAAKQLLLDKGWTQGSYARNALGGTVSCQDETATCYCAVGAVGAVRGPSHDGDRSVYTLLDDIARTRGYTHMAGLNDDPGTALEDILAIFDAAIVCASE